MCISYKSSTLDQHIINLLSKYMDKQCSRAELEKVVSIIESGTHLEEWEYALTKDLNAVLEAKESADTRNDFAILNLHNKIMTSLNEEKRMVSLHRSASSWKFIAATAAAIVVVLSGWWFYKYQNSEITNVKERIAYQGDVAPGKFGATLILGNGKKIILNSAKSGLIVASNKMVYNDGSEVTTSKAVTDVELYSASTGMGNTYTFTLPDGTKVWLNAASQLKFPSKFEHSNRVVSLEGEAYFQVAKDKAHPFIVESKGQQVKVLGTHFNISSYPDEKVIKTTLLEGSIQVANTSLQGEKASVETLQPGQQSAVTQTGSLAVTNVDTTLATAWKNNKFIFENNDIQSVMRMVKRWYNVDIIYSGPLPDAIFGGKVSRFSNISNVLRVLETTGSVHFKIEGRKIYVSK